MKGMFDLLERAGLVRRVEEAAPSATDAQPSGATHEAMETLAADSAPPNAESTAQSTAQSTAESTGMSLEHVYAAAAVPPCAYPAERLLRLIDGLKAMDPSTRTQTIHALDSADDSWSLDDPKRDAAAKVAALERHAASIRAGVAQAERQTQAQQSQLAQRQEASVAEIRRQIADFEGLLAREIARGAQEHAALEAALQAQRESANHELSNLTRASGAMAALIAQFPVNTTN